MAKLPDFIVRNGAYEIPKKGYHRTILIEALDNNTFKNKSYGTKGWMVLEPNCMVLLTIESFLDNDMVGVFVEKFDVHDNPLEPFRILISRNDLLQLIQKS